MTATETRAEMADRLMKEHAATPREGRVDHLVSAWRQLGYSDARLAEMVAAAREVPRDPH